MTMESTVAPPRGRIAIQDVSSWILRVGVITSVLVMFGGLVMAFVQGGVSVQQMEGRTFVDSLPAIARGLTVRDPFALMEAGILLLVLTPILRVFAAVVLFALEERDRLYTAVTFLVLLLTAGSLLFIR
jgi:uncharacterized membrane protein